MLWTHAFTTMDCIFTRLVSSIYVPTCVLDPNGSILLLIWLVFFTPINIKNSDAIWLCEDKLRACCLVIRWLESKGHSGKLGVGSKDVKSQV